MDYIKLKSGKQVYAHCGILGINDDLNEIYEGYDGGVWSRDNFYDEDEEQLTKEDLHEIADIAIARWQAFKESL